MGININEKDLEHALNKKDEELKQKNPQSARKESPMTRDEEIGFHKGSLNTLISERNELIKMIGNVNVIIQAHLKRLEEIGIKIEQPK